MEAIISPILEIKCQKLCLIQSEYLGNYPVSFQPTYVLKKPHVYLSEHVLLPFLIKEKKIYGIKRFMYMRLTYLGSSVVDEAIPALFLTA